MVWVLGFRVLRGYIRSEMDPKKAQRGCIRSQNHIVDPFKGFKKFYKVYWDILVS